MLPTSALKLCHMHTCTHIILYTHDHMHAYEPTQTVQNVHWLAFNKETGLYFEDTFSYVCYCTSQLETIKMLAVYLKKKTKKKHVLWTEYPI